MPRTTPGAAVCYVAIAALRGLSMRTIVSRRALLLGAAAWLGPRSAVAAPAAYEVRDLVVPGDRRRARRFALLLPRHTSEPVPLLVALHGLGETIDERLGVFAWLERYGLARAYERLLRPPITEIGERPSHWSTESLLELNQDLARRPFAGLAVACPFTPDAFRIEPRATFFDEYARWIVEEVVPRSRRETPILEGPEHVGIDGVSLGGYVGLEVFLRQPTHFGSWGGLQAAISTYQSKRYAEELQRVLAKTAPRRLRIGTSRADVFRDGAELLSRHLRERAIEHDVSMPPGAHNQAFLRDRGTLEMLLWHDRALRR